MASGPRWSLCIPSTESESSNSGVVMGSDAMDTIMFVGVSRASLTRKLLKKHSTVT